jgi:hypothetical protein
MSTPSFAEIAKSEASTPDGNSNSTAHAAPRAQDVAPSDCVREATVSEAALWVELHPNSQPVVMPIITAKPS